MTDFCLIFSTLFKIFLNFFKILLPYVVRSPVSKLDEPIKNNLLFETKLDEFIRKTPLF